MNRSTVVSKQHVTCIWEENMKNIEEVKNQINELKSYLNTLTESSSELYGDAILKTSKDLDELINLYNKMLIETDSRK